MYHLGRKPGADGGPLSLRSHYVARRSYHAAEFNTLPPHVCAPKEALGSGCCQPKSSPCSGPHLLCGSEVLRVCSFGGISELKLSLGLPMHRGIAAFPPEGLGLCPIQRVYAAPPRLEACKVTPFALPLETASGSTRFGLPGETTCSQRHPEYLS